MSLTEISKKPIALVTGGSRGIGAAICLRLAQEGFHVLINYASRQENAEAVRAQIIQQGGQADLCRFDVAQSDQVEEAIQHWTERLGTFSVLVNNAGITKDSLLIRLKNEDLDHSLNVNLKGAIFCSRAVARSMMKAKHGSIIQISSLIGECGNAGQSAYAAAKAGLIGFSKSIAKELASRQIRVNVVTPGYITTEMTETLTDTQKEAILRSIPLGSYGTPEDVAFLVAFLASSKSHYITGQVIGLNGGMYI